MDDEHRLILKLFARAAARSGSASHLAIRLGIPDTELSLYLQGRAIPPDGTLLQAVAIILDELPAIRRDTSPQAWDSLRLPK